jgi:dephospho-CoA kinase
MSKPVIGLVGGIGAGKSRVAAALACRGGRIVSGDEAGHEALRQSELKQRIAARWPGVIDAADEVDRRKLGAIVFADEAERLALEQIVRPWIGERLRAEIEAARLDPAVAFVVLDAAVMLEAGWTDVCDLLVYVNVPRDVRLKRITEQRGWSAEEVARREAAQMSVEQKAAAALVTIDNAGPPEALEPQIDQVLERLKKSGASTKRR